MRQLLWKEWRERRCWLLGWGASIIVLTAWGAFPLFLGEWESGNSWCLPWLMITAMFIGAGAYSSELAPGRAAFACELLSEQVLREVFFYQLFLLELTQTIFLIISLSLLDQHHLLQP